MNNNLEEYYYFPTPIYIMEKLDFFNNVKMVAEEYREKTKNEIPFNEIYPVLHTQNFTNDERIKDFVSFISVTALTILDYQGYDVSNAKASTKDLWLQSHYKLSSMEQHVHGYGSYISGFYFLECPEDCPKFIIHDTRTNKLQLELPQKNMNEVSISSSRINFDPKPGMFVFTNSWLSHSFNRNPSDNPFSFIHFNVFVNYDEYKCNTPIIV